MDERNIRIVRDGMYYLVEDPGVFKGEKKPRRMWFKGKKREDFDHDNRFITYDREGRMLHLIHLDPFIIKDKDGKNPDYYAAPVYKIVTAEDVDTILQEVTLPAYSDIWLKLGRYFPLE